MEIVEGKFYKTRDGRKVGPMRRQSNGWVADSGRIDDNGAYDWYMSGNYDCYNQETSVDLIAEWQDEPKKEILDMSEVKFKVGDVVAWPVTKSTNQWQNFEIKEIDEKNKAYNGWDAVSGSGAFCFNWEIELIKSAAATSVPEFGTKWVFNDGQDFVVRVVGFNDKGQIVLEVLENKNRFALLKIGSYFTFENEPEKFGEFYKPWVEKVEKQKIVGFNAVVRWKEDKSISFFGCFDTEEEARQEVHNQWNGEDLELLDVVKVEWSEK